MSVVTLDSDGVFFDFNTQVLNLFGETPNQMRNDTKMWALANAHPEFWSSMPLLPGAHELWAATKHLNPLVLTGCPKSDFDRASQHKRACWKKHFDHTNVITCLSRDKAVHMVNQGDFLVDDMSKNLKRWIAAGGRGYRYDGDANKCIAFLKGQGVL